VLSSIDALLERNPAATNFLQDRLGGGGPNQRFRYLGVRVKVFLDRDNELSAGAEAAAA